MLRIYLCEDDENQLWALCASVSSVIKTVNYTIKVDGDEKL